MAYYKRNEFELSIPINDLKPGVQVCIQRNITYGWNVYTGLTLYKPYTIKRVTPKKTKVICEDGTEFYTKETAFLLPSYHSGRCNSRRSQTLDSGFFTSIYAG